jgi:GNAT superfamily N-acetyltransferase
VREALVRDVTLGDGGRLGRFFAAISGEEAVTRHFHPHAFTHDEARRICSRPAASRDIYILAMDEDEVVGYAMLRGWDEGYEVPSFGLCVLPSHQGAGLGSRLLDYALECACARGAPRVMLKVNFDNHVARQLYESRGFAFLKLDDEQLVGYKHLPVGRQERE